MNVRLVIFLTGLLLSASQVHNCQWFLTQIWHEKPKWQQPQTFFVLPQSVLTIDRQNCEIHMPCTCYSPPARHEAIPFLFCCYVTYCIVYRIVTTVSGFILYRGKMYRCRPTCNCSQESNTCIRNVPPHPISTFTLPRHEIDRFCGLFCMTKLINRIFTKYNLLVGWWA